MFTNIYNWCDSLSALNLINTIQTAFFSDCVYVNFGDSGTHMKSLSFKDGEQVMI